MFWIILLLWVSATPFPTRSPVAGTPAPFPYPSERTAYIYPSGSSPGSMNASDTACIAALPPGFVEHVEASRVNYSIQAFLHYDSRPLPEAEKFRTLTSFAPIARSLSQFLSIPNPFGTRLTAIGAPCANCLDWTLRNPDDLMLVGFSRVRQYSDSCFYNSTFLCAAIVDSETFTPSPTFAESP